MMFVMHDSETYGEACIGGEPMTDEAIARRCGTTLKTYRKCLQELDNAGVVSRKDNGVLFCRRMVRDEQERKLAAERQRLSRDRHGDVTEMSRPCHGDVTAMSQPSSTSTSASLQGKEEIRAGDDGSEAKSVPVDVIAWLSRHFINGPMAAHVLSTTGVTVSDLESQYNTARATDATNPAASACQRVCTALGSPIPKATKKPKLSPVFAGLRDTRAARTARGIP